MLIDLITVCYYQPKPGTGYLNTNLMKLSELGLVKTTLIAFIGELLETNILSSEGEPYFLGKLVEPITVRCSTDKEILPLEGVTELYVRKRDVDSDAWVYVDEKDPKKGYFIPGYKSDFSKGQEMCLYQETTIAEWTRSNRTERGARKRSSINDKIRENRTAKAAELTKPEPVANGKKGK